MTKFAQQAHLYEAVLSSNCSAFSRCFNADSSYLNGIARKGHDAASRVVYTSLVG
jgi:hypothetical protein